MFIGYRLNWTATIALLVSGVVLNPPTIAAQRSLLGESSAAIVRQFGAPWSRLTQKLPTGETQITYRYNPAPVRRIFPETKNKLGFYVVFVNDRATEIRLYAHGDLMSNYPEKSDRLFAALFGYPAPKNFPLYKKALNQPDPLGGSLQVTGFCLADGIATRHEWVSVPEITLEAKVMRDEACQLSSVRQK